MPDDVKLQLLTGGIANYDNGGLPPLSAHWPVPRAQAASQAGGSGTVRKSSVRIVRFRRIYAAIARCVGGYAPFNCDKNCIQSRCNLL